MAKKTLKKVAFHKRTIAELRAIVENFGCGEASRRLTSFEAALKKARISAKTPISAGTIIRLAGMDALEWLADNDGQPGDRDTVFLADHIRDEIEAGINTLVAERLDAQLTEG